MAGRAIVEIDTHVIKRRISKVGDVMARGAICSGWQVIAEFTNTDRIVMARFTATHKRSAAMIKVAGGEGAHTVANTTIFNGRHVVEGFTAGINTMAGRTIVHDVGMIDEGTSETINVMARRTIGTGYRVAGHRRCFSGRVNTIAIIVTQFTRLY